MPKQLGSGQVFVLDVDEVLEAPGLRQRFVLAGPLSGVALPSAHIPEHVDVHVELTLESQGAAVIAAGLVSARWVAECRRCLRPTTGHIEVGFEEFYQPPLDASHPSDPTEDQTFRLRDRTLDLRPMLREALTLQLPLAPLCAESCVGPAPDTHPVGDPNEPADADSPSQPRRDPRWAALDQVRFD